MNLLNRIHHFTYQRENSNCLKKKLTQKHNGTFIWSIPIKYLVCIDPNANIKEDEVPKVFQKWNHGFNVEVSFSKGVCSVKSLNQRFNEILDLSFRLSSIIFLAFVIAMSRKDLNVCGTEDRSPCKAPRGLKGMLRLQCLKSGGKNVRAFI